MGTWQSVGTSWKVAAHGLAVVGCGAFVNLLAGLAALPLAGQGDRVTAPLLAAGLLLGLVNVLVMPLVQGGYLAFAHSRLSSEPPRSALASFWEGARRSYGRLLGFEALTIAMIMVLGIVGVLVFGLAGLSAPQGPAVSVTLTLLATAPVGIGLYGVLLITTMAPVSIVVEGLGVGRAIRRGLRVGRAIIGKVVLVTGALLLTLIPAMILVAVPGVLQAGGGATGVVWRFIGVVLQSVATAVSTVLFAVALVQLYRHRTGSSS